MKMSVTTEEMSGGPGGNQTSAPTANGGSPPAPAGSAVRTTMTEDVVKCGYLRKLKGKKKFFVLHRETETGGQARLEYYANERKFRLGHLPKKTIILRHCFNINRTDSKCKFAIALHTHNDCVRIAMSTEEELTEWLRLLNLYAGDEDDGAEELVALGTAPPMPTLKPHFEHVWLVTALNKGLGSKENIIGPYRLCLTSKELTLLKVGDYDEKTSMIKFPLNVIRSVSHDTTFGCFFHIEFGRLAVTGPGQLSLKTEDNNIAQNMHLLILKAMQNYSKEDLLPRDGVTRRGRTYTWNSETGGRPGSFHGQTPPISSRLNSVDHGTMRIRTESMGSCGGSTGMSPPMPIHTPPPSFSPLCSTTDSASSSYSVDYENNNGANQSRLMTSLMSMMELGSSAASGTGQYSKSIGDDDDDEPYVPFNPLSQQPSSLTLSIHPHDTSDYVETTVGSAGTATTSTSATSNYMDMQSPMENNYMPMSPAGSAQAMSNGKPSNGYNGKLSNFHSRNSSLVEEYVTMPANQPRRCESEASETGGSTAGLDDAYLDMDFNAKLNMSNEDMRRMSPASTESLQSGTPSYPLEKVSSYLLPSDDLDDEPRPVRAYSVGSRSDTGATKGRFGKSGRLEAVQETFRLRAASVGARANPRTKPSAGLFSPTTVHPPSISHGSTSSVSSVALSSSWSGSGSTGRWPIPRGDISPAVSGMSTHSRQNSDTVDSDLMELDFSHNRDKARKRSLGSSGGGLMTPTGSVLSKSIESPDNAPYMQMSVGTSSSASPYVASAPISISQKKDVSSMRLTGLDLKKDEGYLEMDFPSQKPEPVVVKPSDKVVPALFSLNGVQDPKPQSSMSPSPWTLSPKPDTLNLSTSPCTTTSTGISPCLSRIEESPEKQEPKRALGQSSSAAPTNDIGATTSSVTYTTIEHLNPSGKKSPSTPSPSPIPLLSKTTGVSCGISKYPTITSVTYSQIDFKKSASEPVKNN